jgi:dTDP-4-amino-4,6-dideoxygalactose transaminase
MLQVFEEKIVDFLGVNHAITIRNATAAMGVVI